MPDVLPTINNEPPQGIQVLLDTVYLWNPDVANDLIEKINELLAKLGDVSGTIPPYSALEAPVQQYTPCYNGDNVYVAARDLEELPTTFDPTEWILIATKAPVLQAGTGISIDGNEISVTSEISSGAAAGATAVQPGELGTAAYAATTDFATSAQGGKADTAVQPGDLATVATTGDYDDLLDKPTLGTAAAADITDFATATQGGKADTALQPTNVVDNLNSESSTDVLSANQGRVLESQIVALEGRGHYLSSWNCSTGLAGTNPPSSPYVYKAGDYFIVSAVGSTNYRPSGTQYVTGVASSVVETEDVAVNDTYTFDGTNWSLLKTSKVDALPPQTGQSGKFLTTDGTDASWSDKPLVNNANTPTAIGIGSGTINSNGVSVGYNTYCFTGGVVIGYGAKITGTGHAESVAIGKDSQVQAKKAIQIGAGTNADSNTFKVANENGNYEIMSADGTIPEARLADTTNAQEGDVLTLDSNGNAVWQAGGDPLPDQTGHSGHVLTTDGFVPGWVAPTTITFRTWEANE